MCLVTDPGAGCTNDRRPEHTFLADELPELRRRVVEHRRQVVVVQSLGDRGIGQRLGHHGRHLGDDGLGQAGFGGIRNVRDQRTVRATRNALPLLTSARYSDRLWPMSA